jgi:predicted histone-like DNA-binding protein
MSLIYHKYQNKNEDSKAYGKWYARAVIKETVSIEEVALKMQDNCTVKRADILAVLSELGPTITEMLQSSKGVKIPYLGTFKLGISSEGADAPENFTVRKNIKGVHVLFRAESTYDANGKYSHNMTRGVRLMEDTEYTSPKDENQQGDIENP